MQLAAPANRGPSIGWQSYDAPVLLREGDHFAEYSIERLLGAGGMGEVYLARHPRLPRHDALKVLPLDVSGDREFRDRFHREADLAAGLYHPHIVGLHDRGEFDGKLWIAMDYVDGPDTAALLGSTPAGFAVDDVVELLDAIAEALDYAHANGLLHRDVKPSNVLTSQPKAGKRRILLTDFGIARRLDEVSGLTATNMTVGTVNYCAPEQLTGETVDERTDQYALAATAYHWLCGSAPFAHTNPAVVIGKHLSAPPPPISARLPEFGVLDGVFARALAKDPADRYACCGDFAAAFTEAVDETRSLPSAVVRRSRSTDDTLDARVVKAAAAPTLHAAAAREERSSVSMPGRARGTSRRTVLAAGAAVAVIVAVAVAVTLYFDRRDGETASAAAPAASTSSRAAANPGPSATTAAPVVAAPASPPVLPTPAAPKVRYFIPACYSGYGLPEERPEDATILYCADGGAQLTHLTWSSWGADGAVGKGILSVRTCVPSCAEGCSIGYPVVVAAANPQVPPMDSRCIPNSAVYSDMTLAFSSSAVPHDAGGMSPNTMYQGMPAIAFSTNKLRADAVPLTSMGCW